MTVAVSAGAPLERRFSCTADGGGEIPSAGLDTDNDYSTVTNGGEFTDPTYIRPGG